MSVIVAVKENDVVYMGADSQTSIGGNKIHVLNESGFKIVIQENGVLVGMCGDVGGHNAVTTQKNFVSLDENGSLTKKHIVNEIIPKLLNPNLKIYNEKKQDLSISLIIAFRDKLYKIMSNLTVIRCNTYTSSGSGKNYTRYDMYAHSDLPVKERIVKALRSSANRDSSVGAPFVLIDSKNLEYEIVE